MKLSKDFSGLWVLTFSNEEVLDLKKLNIDLLALISQAHHAAKNPPYINCCCDCHDEEK